MQSPKISWHHNAVKSVLRFVQFRYLLQYQGFLTINRKTMPLASVSYKTETTQQKGSVIDWRESKQREPLYLLYDIHCKNGKFLQKLGSTDKTISWDLGFTAVILQVIAKVNFEAVFECFRRSKPEKYFREFSTESKRIQEESGSQFNRNIRKNPQNTTCIFRTNLKHEKWFLIRKSRL